MSLVVTGATGHLGSLVIDSLLARGIAADSIVAAGRNTDKLEALAAKGVRTAVISFDDPATLDAAFVDAEAVLLVSSSEVGKRVAQHQAAIDAAAKAGARLVYTSAPKADSTSLVLAPEHKATEEAIIASGIDFTILRNNWYTENYADQVAQAVAGGTFLTSAGDGRVASATRADFAEAAAVVLTTPGHSGAVYELGGDTAWSFPEFVDAINAAAGSDVVLADVSTADHVATLVGFGLDEGTAGFVAALDSGIRDGALADTDGTLSRLIGRPTTPIAESISGFVAK